MKTRVLLGALIYVPVVNLAVLAVVNEPLFGEWMREDAWVEWSTFVAFVVAAGMYLSSLKAVEPELERRRWAQALIAGAALFCVFVAGEEVSWGQRLVGYTPPEVFLEHNFQQELNVHNLMNRKELLGVPLDSRFMVALVALVYGVLGPLLGRFVAWIDPAAPPVWLAPLFIAIAVVEYTYPVSLGGEAAELSLGLGFLASSRLKGVSTRAAGAAVTLAMGPVLVFVFSVLFAEDRARSARAEAELVSIGTELTQGEVINRDKLSRKSSVHKRIFTATEAGYLRFKGEKRYFIDPWGNPYWVSYRRSRADQLWLYSFGPNRRRDLETSERDPDRGDDILVQVPLGEASR